MTLAAQLSWYSPGGRPARRWLARRWLWRAAPDELAFQGTSFAETRETAELYLANPGFGGANLYRVRVAPNEGNAVDLTGWSARELAARLMGWPDPGAVEIDEWLPQQPEVLDALAAGGIEWALVSESYPAETVTWIWTGETESVPDLELEQVTARGP